MEFNHKLIELHNNFPRFNLLNLENESDKEILARVKRHGKRLLERIKELKADNDHLFLSRKGTYSEKNLPKIQLPRKTKVIPANWLQNLQNVLLVRSQIKGKAAQITLTLN